MVKMMSLILLSLKDYFERSKESQNSEDKFSPVEEGNNLNRNVESLFHRQNNTL